MNFQLLLHFVRQDLIDRHASTALGAMWALLLPLANILIFTLVFSQIMGARLQSFGLDYLGEYSYSIYLVIGLLAWNAFAATITRISQVYHEKAGLITKVKVPLFWLPLYVVISESIVFAISMVFFVVFLWLVGFNWGWQWLWLPIIFAIQQLFAYGLGLLFAIFSVFIRDTTTVVTVATQLWFWLTPVVYVPTILPARWEWLVDVNPMASVVTALREALILNQLPNLFHLSIIVAIGCGLLVTALTLGKKLEKDLRDFL